MGLSSCRLTQRCERVLYLSTEDYDSAAQGLRTTRRFKKYTAWLRIPINILAKCMHIVTFEVFKSSAKSLVWTSRTKDERIRMKRAHSVETQVPGRASELQAFTRHGEAVREKYLRLSVPWEKDQRIDKVRTMLLCGNQSTREKRILRCSRCRRLFRRWKIQTSDSYSRKICVYFCPTSFRIGLMAL